MSLHYAHFFIPSALSSQSKMMEFKQDSHFYVLSTECPLLQVVSLDIHSIMFTQDHYFYLK